MFIVKSGTPPQGPARMSYPIKVTHPTGNSHSAPDHHHPQSVRKGSSTGMASKVVQCSPLYSYTWAELPSEEPEQL